MARCTTRGLREHSLRINSGLGGDMLTRLDKKKETDRQTDERTNSQKLELEITTTARCSNKSLKYLFFGQITLISSY